MKSLISCIRHISVLETTLVFTDLSCFEGFYSGGLKIPQKRVCVWVIHLIYSKSNNKIVFY